MVEREEGKGWMIKREEGKSGLWRGRREGVDDGDGGRKGWMMEKEE